MTAKRKAQIRKWQAKGAASRKRAAKKVFAMEYRQGRAFGASKSSAKQWALAAATSVSKKYGSKKALAAAKLRSKLHPFKAGVKNYKLKSEASYVRNIRNMSKHSSIKLKYGKY